MDSIDRSNKRAYHVRRVRIIFRPFVKRPFGKTISECYIEDISGCRARDCDAEENGEKEANCLAIPKGPRLFALATSLTFAELKSATARVSARSDKLSIALDI